MCYKKRRYFAGDDMEIVGGFMVMMSIISLFLAVVWLIMPFVVFAIKGKQERTLEILESMEQRLMAIEAHLQSARPEPASTGNGRAVSEPPASFPDEHEREASGSAAEKNSSNALPAE
jgi:hypothetical protein